MRRSRGSSPIRAGTLDMGISRAPGTCPSSYSKRSRTSSTNAPPRCAAASSRTSTSRIIPPPSIYPRGYAFLDDNPDRARCHMRWWEDIRPKEGGSRGVRPWATTGRTLSLWHRRVGRRTMSVLVTYATAFGSTREIAERVGEVIGKWVPSAVVRPVDEMDTVAGYDAIVVGSAVHNQVWQPEAREFVRRNAADL